MRVAWARILGSRAERGAFQWSPVETFETTKPAFSPLRRTSLTCASVVFIWNHGTSPSQSSIPSYPAFFTSSSPCSKLQPFGIILSPIDFFMAHSFVPGRFKDLLRRSADEPRFESDGYLRGARYLENRKDSWRRRRPRQGAKCLREWHQ